MRDINRLWIVAVGLVGVAMLCLGWMVVRDRQSSESARLVAIGADAQLVEQIRDLTQRVAALEVRGAGPSGAATLEATDAPARSAIEPSDSAERLQSLEDKVAAILREQPIADSELAVRRPPRDLNDVERWAKNPAWGAARYSIAQDEALLRQFPDDPKASDVLYRLIDRCLTLGGPALGQRAFDKYVPKIRAEAWQVDRMKAFLAFSSSQHDEHSASLQRLIASPEAPLDVRVQAKYDLALSYRSAGAIADAQSLAQAILNDYPKDRYPHLTEILDSCARLLESARTNK